MDKVSKFIIEFLACWFAAVLLALFFGVMTYIEHDNWMPTVVFLITSPLMALIIYIILNVFDDGV